jgi:hypothetical protein
MEFHFLYLWEDIDSRKGKRSEVKFGEHFESNASSMVEAIENTKKYIRSSLSRQKHKSDQGRILIHEIWDVTQHSKDIGYFRKHSKLDDKIRPFIGNVVQSEVHDIIPALAIARVNKYLNKHSARKASVATLSTAQYEMVESLIGAIENGHRDISLNLCARFGKTIMALALFIESDADIMIATSYVLSSLASFEKEVEEFEQFKDIVPIQADDDNLEERVKECVDNGQKALVLLSMCNSDKRDSRIEKIYSYGETTLTFIDEADFGAHHEQQLRPFKECRRDNDIFLFMTGTNIDRAIANWQITHSETVTYPELLFNRTIAEKELQKT